jgi:hypothetical protein
MAKGSAIRSERSQIGVLDVPTYLSHGSVVEISHELRKLPADVFALYLKMKNFPDT